MLRKSQQVFVMNPMDKSRGLPLAATNPSLHHRPYRSEDRRLAARHQPRHTTRGLRISTVRAILLDPNAFTGRRFQHPNRQTFCWKGTHSETVGPSPGALWSTASLSGAAF